MLKKSSPKVAAYNPAAEVVGFTKRSPEEIREIEQRLNAFKRSRRTNIVTDEKKIKLEKKVERDEAMEEFLAQQPPAIIPVLQSETECDRIAAEGECNPRCWSADNLETFLKANDLEQAATKLRSLRMTGETFLQQNRQTLGIQLDIRMVITLMKFINMLRKIEHSYQEKRKPKLEDFFPTPEMIAAIPPVPVLKRKVGAEMYESIMAKRQKFLQQEGITRQLTPTLHMPLLPNISPELRLQGQTSRYLGRPKICYKCKGEGHLGRECTQQNTGKSGYSNSQTGANDDEDWGVSDSSQASLPKPQNISAADDDDWGAPATTPAAGKPKPVATATDDDWDAPTSSNTGSTQHTTSIASATTVDDDGWGSSTPTASALSTPRSSFDSGNRSFNGRGGGSFSGGRGRGGGRGGGPGSGPRVCFRCNQEGHMSRECPTGGSNNGPRVGGGKKICYNCQQEGHLGRECPEPKNYNSNRQYSKPRQDDWGTSAATQPNLVATATDDDWDAPMTTPDPVKPKADAAATDDDWDTPATTPTPAKPKAANAASTGDDDWDSPTPAVPSTGSAQLTTSTPSSASVNDDDGWGMPTVSTSSTPNTSFDGGNRSFNSRGRGSFSGGRGRGGGRGGGPGSGPRVCFRCNQEGHMSRECPNGGSNNGPRVGGGKKICYNCQQEGHLGRECPEPKNYNSNRQYSKPRQDDWGTSAATQPNLVATATDDDWDAPMTTPDPVKPKADAAATDDDWDTPATTPTPAKPKAANAASTGDDDWDSPAPAVSSTGTAQLTTSTPSTSVIDDDGWGMPTVSTSSTPNTSFDGGNRSFNGRGRGSFSGERGRGGGRGGGPGSGPRVCFRCNQEGHMSWECPSGGSNNGSRVGGGKKICYNCQQEGHLGRECPEPKNYNSNRQYSKPRQDDWGTSAATQPNLVATATDDDWDAPMTTPDPVNPKAGAAATDDDWDSPAPAVSSTGTAQLTTSTPSTSVNDDDGWGMPTVSTSSTPNTSFDGGNRSFNSRGRGSFSGGRGRGGGRGGGPGSGPRVCFRCNQEGHMSRECPNGGSNNGPRVGGGKKICYNCQQEGHLGRECPEPKNYNSNRQYSKPRQDDWGTSAATQSNLVATATDDDWDAPMTTPDPVKPKADAAATDDDWDTPATTPTPAKTKAANAAATGDDDWDSPVPAVSSTGAAQLTTSTPSTSVNDDDGWGMPTVSPSSTPNTSFDGGNRSFNSRGRGSFSEGRGRGGGRGGGPGSGP